MPAIEEDLHGQGYDAQGMHKGSQRHQQLGRLRKGRDASLDDHARQPWTADVCGHICFCQILLCHLQCMIQD